MPRFPHACSSILFSQPRRNRVSYFWAFLGCAVALGAPWEGESKENPKVAKAGLPRAPTVFSQALSPAHPPPSTGPANQPSACPAFCRLYPAGSEPPAQVPPSQPETGSRKEACQSCQGRAGPGRPSHVSHPLPVPREKGKSLLDREPWYGLLKFSGKL